MKTIPTSPYAGVYPTEEHEFSEGIQYANGGGVWVLQYYNESGESIAGDFPVNEKLNQPEK